LSKRKTDHLLSDVNASVGLSETKAIRTGGSNTCHVLYICGELFGVTLLQAAFEMIRFQLRHGNDLLAVDCLRKCDVCKQCLLRVSAYALVILQSMNQNTFM